MAYNNNKIATIGELLVQGYMALNAAGIESYHIDAQLLLSKAIGRDRLFILTHRDMSVDKEKIKKYNEFLKMRAKKMPVKYILGECEFMGYMFEINEGVLIPRPDTEILVENVIFFINKHGYREICDVCTGSGIIGITIAKECPDTKVLCLDISETAIKTAKSNAKRLEAGSVTVEQSDNLEFALARNLNFDVIVSNPPYIRTEDMDGLMEDVRLYEPHGALCGGKDGLYFYRKITEQSVKLLKPGGMLAFEIGYDQKNDVISILSNNGFKNILNFKDLSGNDRVVIGFIS